MTGEMTREEALQILDTIPTIGEQVDALEMAIKALEQELRDCKTCIHSDKGKCAGTEECHECMWESKYEQEPCEDAISRKDAINAIKRTVATEQIKELKRLPSVQPKPKTGHWMEDDMTYCGVELVNYKCDKCGEMCGAWRKGLKPDKLPKYCMNCGAKMLPTG